MQAALYTAGAGVSYSDYIYRGNRLTEYAAECLHHPLMARRERTFTDVNRGENKSRTEQALWAEMNYK